MVNVLSFVPVIKISDEAAKGEATHRIPETDMRVGVFDTYGSLRDAYCYRTSCLKKSLRTSFFRR